MALVIEHLNIASPAMPLQKLSHLLDLLFRVRADSFTLRRGIDFANRRIWRLQPTSQDDLNSHQFDVHCQSRNIVGRSGFVTW
jgi:hypothetical protein